MEQFFVIKIDDAMDDSIQYKLQPMVTSILDGNVFLFARALSTNKRNFFLIIDSKCIFFFTSEPVDRVHYEYRFKFEGRVEKVTK